MFNLPKSQYENYNQTYWLSPTFLMVYRTSTKAWEEWAFEDRITAEIALSEIAGLAAVGEPNALDIERAIIRPGRGTHIN